MQIKANFIIQPAHKFKFPDLPQEVKAKAEGEYKGWLGKKGVYLLKQEGYPYTLISRENLIKYLPGFVPYTFQDALALIKKSGGKMVQGDRSVSIQDGYLIIEDSVGKNRWTPQVEVMTSEEEVWLLA